ncbi:TonB-dependent receptor domain-containing protein [Hydrogenophaga sp. BPS33]|uniref:TonB-dependent receptor domain-containing protein n=1 Tax=Hydrogenophaga sp. BPS33 TaxID=2651974 RepID=UPI00131F53DF|nr:TonB-dependent receptor [Hydrogenophaga sp. BPS33]QHE86599.1 TonB-dependent receptor [Hydrogenophaga sp. BPS33]
MKNRKPRAPLAAISLATLACLCTSTVHAQSVPEASLAETVVTATRVETRTDEVLSDVVLIDAEVIAQSTARSLSEVLSRRAGLQMSANGGRGKQSGLFVRGTETRHVLLLVDGVRVGSSTAGSASWDNIPLSAIDRIEVLKGPASALYGSDAVGGVVQVFTKRGAKGFHPQASVTVGSFGHHEVTAGFSGGNDSLTYNLSVGSLREDGFSSTNPNVAFGNHNPDKDGFDQDSLSASLRWKLAPGWTTDLNFTQANATSQFDQGPGTFDVRSEAVTRVAGWGLTRQWSADSRTQLRISRSDDKSDSFENSVVPSVFNTTQTQITLQHDWNTAIGNLLVGAESIKESVSGTQAYSVNARTTDAAFVGLTGQAGKHLWQANLRRDENSQFGGATTGFASYGYQLNPNWRPHIAYGTSFKAPSFNTLYYVSPFFNGNPSTQPERGKNREAGLTYTQGAHEVKLTRFDNRVRGFITLQPAVANVPRVRIEGWSLTYTGSAGAWSWTTNLELLDARNLQNNRKLQRRADEVLSASLDHKLGAWTWGASVQLVAERFDDAANARRLPGFGTVDLHARYALNKDWSLALRLNNAGDKFYETAYGYNQPGRAAFLTLNWAPQK